MRFTWDPGKSDANLAARGFDFEFATLIFAGPTLAREDTRRSYGERRIIAIGLAQGIALTVAYTDRVIEADIERRIISGRRSNRRERKAYQVALERG
ncbi:MAG TPA: BrnT family toxin [Gemmatimonadales bacterium]